LFAATDLLQCAESNAGFVENIDSGYDPKTKAQPSVWKKARQVRSKTKVLFTVFFNEKRAVNQRTIKNNCLQILRRLSATQYASSNKKIGRQGINPLNPELNPICYLLALLAHHFLHVSRIRVKSLILRLLMSYIYMTLVT
jgi:hypothetical protein